MRVQILLLFEASFSEAAFELQEILALWNRTAMQGSRTFFYKKDPFYRLVRKDEEGGCMSGKRRTDD
jgi:hypothetical protein